VHSWPEHTVRIITPFSPGISVDVAARALADALAKRWKQPVVVENRPGADTTIGTQAFLEMRDGHALLFTTHSTFTVVPLLRAKISYDPIGDAKPISLAVEDFLSVVVTPRLEIGSLAEFVKLAHEQPTKLNFYAVPGAPYLAYLAFQQRVGMATTFVAYNNPVSAISDLSEGRIHIAVLPLASVLGAVQAEKIRLLAVTNAVRTRPRRMFRPSLKRATRSSRSADSWACSVLETCRRTCRNGSPPMRASSSMSRRSNSG
jgi:tripartite-type tricarboxylate transporter receptor subunit TctC